MPSCLPQLCALFSPADQTIGTLVINSKQDSSASVVALVEFGVRHERQAAECGSEDGGDEK